MKKKAKGSSLGDVHDKDVDEEEGITFLVFVFVLVGVFVFVSVFAQIYLILT